jgi:hypothetical protein
MSTKFAEPAPVDADEDVDFTELDPLHELCERWSDWIRTRRFYAPPSLPPSILGRLTSGSRGGDGPNAVASPELAAFNQAIESEPMEALDRQVFELHYRYRVKPIKTFATALGIGRQHWYTLLRSFEQRAHAASLEILQRNLDEVRSLRSHATK